MTDDEWREIELARRSLPRMWGAPGGDMSFLRFDPMDGRGPNASLYDARHYLAWVRDHGLGGVKLVTARVVRLRPSALAGWEHDPLPLLPTDLRVWCIRAGAGSTPLWHRLTRFAKQLAPLDADAPFRVASIGRLTAYPAGQGDRSPRKRERTAVAWAAIQTLAALDDTSLLYVLTIRPELVSNVLTVGGVGMGFTASEETLGLPSGTVVLDDRLSQGEKLGWPGYWVHSGDAAEALAALLAEGRVTLADLRPTIARLIECESAIGGAGRELEELVAVSTSPDHRRLASLLTRPRLCKYLIPLLRGDEPLSRMSHTDFQTRLLFETRTAPFSCTVLPEQWAASAQAVLEAADRRYPRFAD
jgi:hypothetical protein